MCCADAMRWRCGGGGNGCTGFENYTASNSNAPRNDSGGGWSAAGYGGWTRETVWTRRMVLIEEGALIVLDSIQTSEQEGGWLGGPLWQMTIGSNSTISEPEGGGDWCGNVFFVPFSTQLRVFAKTGSGQT